MLVSAPLFGGDAPLHQAALAQLVEHRIRNAGVTGSSPVSGTISPFAKVRARLQKPQKSAIFSTEMVGDVPDCSPAIALRWVCLGVFSNRHFKIPPNCGRGGGGRCQRALTATALKNAKARAKPYKLSDEKGLFVTVSPSGGMLWRWKYRVDGVGPEGQAKRIEKLLSLGSYPDVSLKLARERRDAAREQHAAGIDPAEKKQRDKAVARIGAANTFHAVGMAFIEKCRREGLAETTIRKRIWTLGLVERAIGSRPIAEIEPISILNAVRPYEAPFFGTWIRAAPC